MPKHCQNAIKTKAINYTLIADELHCRGKDGNLKLCVLEDQSLEVLHHAYVGMPGGHFLGDTTAKNILWPCLW